MKLALFSQGQIIVWCVLRTFPVYQPFELVHEMHFIEPDGKGSWRLVH